MAKKASWKRHAQRRQYSDDLKAEAVKIGAKVARHGGYATFQLTEVAVTRDLFVAILDRIERLALPPTVVAGFGE